MALHRVICVSFLLILLLRETSSQLSVCGKSPLNTRIVNGKPAPNGSWPWQVSLHVRHPFQPTATIHFCGGSLINREWVLSAAHCFQNITSNASSVTVYLGRQTQGASNSNEESRNASQIINHPLYNNNKPDYDIALLKLSTAVNFTDYILPVCLAASGSSVHTGENVWVTGWGALSLAGPFPDDLMEVNVSTIGNTECTCSWGMYLTDNMMCAARRKEEGGPCVGDSGGPLVIKDGNRWIQLGVVNFVRICGETEYPTVYARVSNYMSWINNHITSDQPGFLNFTSTGIDTDVNFTCAVEPTTPSLPPISEVCGKPALNTRIVNGQSAPNGNWPWQVSLHALGIHFCGGSLINHKWVLSAAHCFQNSITSNASSVTVYLGRQTQGASNPNEESRNVSEIINHPLYNNVDYDIALLILSTAVNFTDYILPVCLAASGSSVHTGESVWVTGWGSLSQDGPAPEDLMEVDVLTIGNNECLCDWGAYITDDMMCAGRRDEEGGTCTGDSGGPLVIKDGDHWVQVGIVNFGRICGETEQTTVYARVSNYMSWINDHITSDQPGYFNFTSTGIDTDVNFTCAVEPSLPPISEVCGKPALNTRIVNGQSAPNGNWPWQVSLHALGIHFCGGSLINHKWVLSAAHCFQNSITSNASRVTAYLGRQTQGASNPNEESRNLSEIINHPLYNNVDYDIALLILSTAVNFTDYILPVCLAALGSSVHTGESVWVTGWGSLSQDGPAPDDLMEVDVLTIGNNECLCDWGAYITDDMMCAGRRDEEGGTCTGDSGGPLVIKDGDHWVQVGIVNFGRICGETEQTTVYARVSNYMSWINDHITSDQPGYFNFTSTGIDTDLNFTCTVEPTTPPISEAVVCGQAPKNTRFLRVIGGSSVEIEGMWPWMASLQKNGKHMCGGTLVDVDWVMSTADCFSGSAMASEWNVVLGRLNQNGSNPFEVTLNVTNITLSNLTGSNIALLHLSPQSTLSNYIQPICLDTGLTFSVGATCWVTGWSTGQGGNKQALQEIQTSVVDCGASTSSENICTGSLTLEQGDAGGPLMCKQGGSWFQASVLTVANSTSTRADMSVFSRVTRFQAFLKQILGTLPSPASSTNTTGGNTTTTTTISTPKPATTSGGPSYYSSLSFLLLLLPWSVQLFT